MFDQLKTKTIESIKTFEIKEPVYNLEVKDNNNYYANRILVHNCDDPNNVKDAESEVVREGTNEWWDAVMTSRVQNFKTTRWIVVQQRTHENDLSGYILSKDRESWVHFMLPMEFDPARKCKTIKIGEKIWEDPRKKKGELLWPGGIGEKELNEIKRGFNHDSYKISGQMQQIPSPAEGGIIKREWFRLWKEKEYPYFEYILQSWDTALTGNKNSADSACTTWGIFKRGRVKNIMLLSVFSEQVEYPELRKMAVRLYRNYEDTLIDEPLEEEGTRNPNHILIEQKVSGYSLYQDLLKTNIPVLKFDPKKYGDKESRCRLVTHLMENGLVWLPTKLPHCKHLTEDSEMFLDAVAKFPKGNGMDIVDSMSQAFIRLTTTGWVANKDDPYFDDYLDEWQKEKKLYY